MNEIQGSFTGGLDLLSGDTEIAPSGYKYLVNGRQRFGDIEPIKKHIELTIPTGKLQGGIAVGDVLIIFVAGKAYYKLAAGDTWTYIAPFSMNAVVDRLWACAVPQSTMNFKRAADTTGDANLPLRIFSNFRISGTPDCVVVQDGTSQPWIIYQSISADGSLYFGAREAKKYKDWQNTSVSTNDREYVPVGNQMMYKDGILYVVSQDSKSIMRSVTGRPLDFMVIVDANGNKLANEVQGGAINLSFNFDFDEITCIYPINLPDSFIYGTARSTRIVTADYTRTIFGEPRYNEAAKIESGIVNQESFVEILGDYTFVDAEGVKSFNAVKQLKFEGRNSIFSKALSALVKDLKQTRSAAITYDNYAMFNLDTKYGNLVVVYDMLHDKWVSLDVTLVTQVMQFLTIETPSETILYALTTRNEVFEMFADTETETAQLRTRAFSPDKTSIEHKGEFLRTQFGASTFAGEVTVIELVDEQESPGVLETKILEQTVASVLYPVRPPVSPRDRPRVDQPTFSTANGLVGRQIAYIIIWNSDAPLEEFEIQTSELQDQNQQRQKQASYVL